MAKPFNSFKAYKRAACFFTVDTDSYHELDKIEPVMKKYRAADIIHI